MRNISVKALIIKKGKVLLLNPKGLANSVNGWDVPGGHVKSMESLLSALKREVYEETMLVVLEAQPIKILSLAQNSTEYVIFLCSVKKGEVNLSSEHVGYRWVSVDELNEETRFNLIKELKSVKRLIEKLIEE